MKHAIVVHKFTHETLKI